MKKKQKIIFYFQTYNWNKLTKKEQDKALFFMYRVLHDLGEDRKFGYGPKFYAQYP